MAKLGPFEESPFLATAVSGGADSLALTLLADQWARARGGRVVGLTVDHGLRPDSAGEARQTGLWLRAHGIEHRILPWSGDKPVSGLQRHARDARYALLFAWCREHGCLHLLTAHHRQDQAETVAIRKARQSGGAGLAAMPAIRELSGLRLLRPFLGIDKARLEQSLRAIAQPWHHDPSNDDLRFTRSRLRREGLDVAALAAEAERQGLCRQAADRRAAVALARHAIIDPAGFATLDARGFDDLSADLARDVLIRLLQTIGGRPYPPRGEALGRLLSAMRGNEARAPGNAAAGTLAFCRILLRRGRWLICREQRPSAPLALQPGHLLRWEDRFLITLRLPIQGLALAPLGERPGHGTKTLIQKGKPRRLAGVVNATLPAIRQGQALVAIPHLGLFAANLAPEAVELRFCPALPLANAPFMPHISG
ncbi:MAG: tRNA lysidine(34) synthetase TilS [Alphaproteobacteria bacterium]